VSLGADAYRALLAHAGLDVRAEYDDEGDNHYYEAVNQQESDVARLRLTNRSI
jgi:hypothetical protein